jgi:hypothetical protein
MTSYLHTSSKGKITAVHVEEDGSRFYLDEDKPGKMYLPHVPNGVHGRYYAKAIISGEISREQYHDDFMLEGTVAPASEPWYLGEADRITAAILAGNPSALAGHSKYSREKITGLITAAARIGLLTETPKGL